MIKQLIEKVQLEHAKRFGASAEKVAYAPGRVEILGNHTDYNEGFVLSSAIDLGICAALSSAPTEKCTVYAIDERQEINFNLPVASPISKPMWANYVLGVVNKLNRAAPIPQGFNAVFSGNIPIGAGLSSSAALELAFAIGLSTLCCIKIPMLELAKICQAAEHEFVGSRCGLLDQISSLFGQEHSLIFCDFRSLKTDTVLLGADACFLMTNTHVQHMLVNSEYNERRKRCEHATAFFASRLDHQVKALRDVSLSELKQFTESMNRTTARRAAHVIGENHRVLKGKELLSNGDLKEFGKLMFQSHQSSRENFENSCRELDVIVEEAKKLPAVLGARLSGGGFGGSVVMLIHQDDAENTSTAIADRYQAVFGKYCDVRKITPSAGASILHGPTTKTH